MKKIILLTILILLPIKLSALESYVVMDPSNNRVLSSSNMNEEMLIASTTKVMTTIVALEHADTTTVLCAGDEILKVYGSMIYLDVGECMPLYDLLVGLMLRSGNDAAMVIATQTLGYDAFIKEMNLTASRIGMKHTKFENPHGLDDDSKNISTAYDMALLMSYVSKNKTFMEITKIKKYKVTSTIETHLWYNKNKLLSTYKYATGGKIGYTTRSGHIFVSSATKAKENLVVTSFKDDNQFVTHKNLYEKTFKEYDKYKVLDKYTFTLKEKYYKNYHLYIKEDVELMLNKNELKKVDIKINLIKKKNIKNGSIVGTAKIYVNKKYIQEVNIYALTKEKKNLSIFERFFYLLYLIMYILML